MLSQNGISDAAIAAKNIDETDTEIKAIVWKLSVRLVPLLIAAQLLAYLDRVNLGFASITANQALGISTIQYSFGVSIFFLAYFLCEYPSNKIMMRVGARLWIARIMITFGLIAASMALVVGPYSFYFVRIILGAAEAGFFPGVLLYLTFWFPRAYRARIIATFQVGIPLSSVIGGPISGAILGMDGVLGLHGW
nr:MFS transporter [Rhizobium sp. P32RR-XVIII]